MQQPEDTMMKDELDDTPDNKDPFGFRDFSSSQDQKKQKLTMITPQKVTKMASFANNTTNNRKEGHAGQQEELRDTDTKDKLSQFLCFAMSPNQKKLRFEQKPKVESISENEHYEIMQQYSIQKRPKGQRDFTTPKMKGPESPVAHFNANEELDDYSSNFKSTAGINKLKAITTTKKGDNLLFNTSKKPQMAGGLMRRRQKEAMQSKLKGTLDIMTFDQSSKAERSERGLSVFKLDPDQEAGAGDQESLHIQSRQASVRSGCSVGGDSFGMGQHFERDTFLEKYEELEQIGEGGAAVVKKVKHRESGVEFAAKVMRKYDSEKEMASRAEFELMNALPDHPNIVKAHEFIATSGWTYLLMELFEGQELQRFAKERALNGSPLS